MSGIARAIPTASRRLKLNWKLALPVLLVAAGAAFYARAQAAPASAQSAQAGAAGARMIGHFDRAHAYALVRETTHGTNLSGDSADWKDVEAARRAIKGEFLWFRHDGKAWVVQDADVLARANAAWAPLDRLGAQMDGYGKQMDEHGKRMEALGKDMAAGAAADAGRRMHEASKPMDALGKRMGALGKQMEQESHEADKTVRALIREALAKGLARPAPANG